MYAFSVALAVNELKTELKPIGQSYFIAQVGRGRPACRLEAHL